MSIVYPSTVLLISPIVFVFLITNDNVSNKYFESNELLVESSFAQVGAGVIVGAAVLPR